MTTLFSCPISKIDEEQRLVFGWASIIDENGEPVVDTQGDVIEEAELEKAAYDFVLLSRRGDAMHEKRAVAQLVESLVFTREKQAALGVDLGKVGWWIGYRVTDAETWEKVKTGEYAAFSIGGRGERVDLAA